MFRVKVIQEGVFRIYSRDGSESMLSRYHVLKEGNESREVEWGSAVNGNYSIAVDGDEVRVDGGKKTLLLHADSKKNGFGIDIALETDERLFGLGDCNRENVMRRGGTYTMHVANVCSYGPISFLMSSYGWGIFVNCTYSHTFDVGDSQKDTIKIRANKGTLDFYVFVADTMKQVLNLYTDLTGKPVILPKFAYGFTFVHNEQTNARSFLWDVRTMRDRDIPCDVMGLEPAWMSKYYDFSTEKKWDKERFYLPSWKSDNQSGGNTFFYALRNMGMQLSLWLCVDYDLFWEEDGNMLEEIAADYQDATIIDPHFEHGISMDHITKKGEPWFEHLKKFVDNGAAVFKLDGANQVLLHHDRLWGGRYLDDEVHNVYPVILAKQMQQGFEQYTGRRALIYTAGAFGGIQQYAASWAGDTGGGWKSIISVFNHAMSGHTNTTVDMDENPDSMHCAALLAWAQQNGWSTWNYPWFLPPEREEMLRFYMKLRSSLFPYIYSMAHNASMTGLPIVRPLSLVYEDTDKFDNAHNLFMLGDSLLVGAFDMHFHLPEGIWIDYWTGMEYAGVVDYEIPEGRGGALFVKKGSVFVTMEPQKYILEKEHDYIIKVYPGGNSQFVLVEDDGFTYDYREGKVAKTFFYLQEEVDSFKLIVKKRTGNFEGRPDNGHDSVRNSIPFIGRMSPVRDMKICVHAEDVSKVQVNGTDKEFAWKQEKEIEFILPAELHESADVEIIFYYDKKNLV